MHLRREQHLLQPLRELWHLLQVEARCLVQLDLENQLGRFRALVEVDLVGLFAEEVGIAVPDEGPIGEIDA
jgi:hypothetical protein